MRGNNSTLQDTSSALASFEDSNLENEPENEKPAAKKKRAAKVTRSRPVRKTKGSVSSTLDESGTLGVLVESNVSDDVATPVNSGKKKLYKISQAAEQFTPTDKVAPGTKETPGTIVKRQLRLRSSKKK